jgi:hypothetical protein
MRSLELLPELTDVLAVRPRQGITTAPAPQTHEDETEPEVVEIGVLRYTAHRVAEVTRFGLAIVGAIFTIAMIAEVLLQGEHGATSAGARSIVGR